MNAITAEAIALGTRYRVALTAFIDGENEEGQLVAALELGRAAFAEGYGLLDMLAIHQESVKSLLGRPSKAVDIQLLDKASEFLTHVASPFEMAHLGWRDMVRRLRLENEQLEKEVVERSAAYLEAAERLDLTQQELRTSEERWRLILNNPIFCISFLDQNQRFVTTNLTFKTMVGYTDEELQQLTPIDISVGGEREINKIFLEELQSGKRQHFEMTKQLRRKDGKLIWIQLYVFAIPDGKSDTPLTLGMMIDSTERKRAQDALQEARAELARVARLNRMGAMTASIAHEINQPLSAMVSGASAGLRWLARSTPDLDETRTALRRIVRDGRRAAEVIEGIRAMFKADQRAHVAVDVNQLVREVLLLAEGGFQKRPIVVETQLDEELPSVTADRVQLQQVVFNLITNATDAMQSVTDRNRTLRIRSGIGSNGDVLVTIEDTGTGINQEDVERIFNSFFTTESHGMGMGLWICRSIIESHGGRLWAAPAHPHGAVFQFSLPSGRIAGE